VEEWGIAMQLMRAILTTVAAFLILSQSSSTALSSPIVWKDFGFQKDINASVFILGFEGQEKCIIIWNSAGLVSASIPENFRIGITFDFVRKHFPFAIVSVSASEAATIFIKLLEDGRAVELSAGEEAAYVAKKAESLETLPLGNR
jgi:hypothetical protein